MENAKTQGGAETQGGEVHHRGTEAQSSKERLSTTQPSGDVDTVFKAFCIGGALGLMLGIALTASLLLAHMAHHDRMFHTPKSEVQK